MSYKRPRRHRQLLRRVVLFTQVAVTLSAFYWLSVDPTPEAHTALLGSINGILLYMLL